MYKRVGKRILDLSIAALILPLVLPVGSLIALLIRLQLGAPVFFKQERLGKDGRPFFITKFRTMQDTRDDGGNLLSDALRLTGTGQFLRTSSLDELPELINILRGEMSFVGPRPFDSRYGSRYTPQQFRRHEVLPGITGWAQVNGRNAISWEAKFEYDVWYVEHQSPRLDLQIIGWTILKLIKREGINQPGQATAEEFKGTLHGPV